MAQAQARNLAALRTAIRQQGFAFSTSTRLGLKESANADNIDFEKHKSDSLAKQKKGQGHWKPELASDSEEAVKADRSTRGPEEMVKLQERTKKTAGETAKAGTSVRDGM